MKKKKDFLIQDLNSLLSPSPNESSSLDSPQIDSLDTNFGFSQSTVDPTQMDESPPPQELNESINFGFSPPNVPTQMDEYNPYYPRELNESIIFGFSPSTVDPTQMDESPSSLSPPSPLQSNNPHEEKQINGSQTAPNPLQLIDQIDFSSSQTTSSRLHSIDPKSIFNPGMNQNLFSRNPLNTNTNENAFQPNSNSSLKRTNEEGQRNLNFVSCKKNRCEISFSPAPCNQNTLSNLQCSTSVKQSISEQNSLKKGMHLLYFCLDKDKENDILCFGKRDCKLNIKGSYAIVTNLRCQIAKDNVLITQFNNKLGNIKKHNHLNFHKLPISLAKEFDKENFSFFLPSQDHRKPNGNNGSYQLVSLEFLDTPEKKKYYQQLGITGLDCFTSMSSHNYYSENGNIKKNEDEKN